MSEHDNQPFSDAAVVAELTDAARGIVHEPGMAPFALVPDGYSVADLDHLCIMPTRDKGTLHAYDLASFIAMTLDRKDPAARVCWDVDTDRGAAAFSTVFNAHSWRDNRLHYEPALSPEWRQWMGKNGKPATQLDFSVFIENVALDIVQPSAANMLEIARSIEAKKAVNFASAIRLKDGSTQFTYEEMVEGSAAKGRLQIPDTFTIGIPVFVGGPRYKIEARLRYRIGSGTLSLWYDLVRPSNVMDDAVQQMVAEVVDKVPLPVYRGGIPPRT